MNSKRKGKVGEREFAALLREHGFDARRGVQFSGGADSPDVVSDALAWLHIEVKRTQALNLAFCLRSGGRRLRAGAPLWPQEGVDHRAPAQPRAVAHHHARRNLLQFPSRCVAAGGVHKQQPNDTESQ